MDDCVIQEGSPVTVSCGQARNDGSMNHLFCGNRMAMRKEIQTVGQCGVAWEEVGLVRTLFWLSLVLSAAIGAQRGRGSGLGGWRGAWVLQARLSDRGCADGLEGRGEEVFR